MIAASVAMKAQQNQEIGLDSLKASKMNRLQRSLVRGRVSAVAKDSTVRVSTFLSSTLEIFKIYLEQNIEVGQHWKASPQVPAIDVLRLTQVVDREETFELSAAILVGHLRSRYFSLL